MQKALLFSLALLGFLSSSYAQPVITASTSNPVAGDVFIGHCLSVIIAILPARLQARREQG